jgi:hypothetical protein
MIDVTPLMRLFAARRLTRLDRLDSVSAQERTLLALVRRAAATRFGRDHGFPSIGSVAEFQARVPLRDYDAMWGQYWRDAFPSLHGLSWPGRTPFLALSSGTSTGHSKYLPVTPDMLRSNARAGFDALAFHLAAKPRSHVFAGKLFLLGGSTALTEEAPGVRSGDLSGIAAVSMPWWVRPFVFPGPGLALLADWNAKIDHLAEASLNLDVRALAGTPSWVLILLDRVQALRRRRAEGGDGSGRPDGPAYPGIELFLHGGVNFAPYRERFMTLLGGGDVDLREVYPASEGFVASADREYGQGLRMNCDHGLFFEFVPVSDLGGPGPRRFWLKDAQVGVEYALALSTCAGLFAYLLGDTVRLVDTSPPRLLVTGRTSWGLSAFGEHLIAWEIEKAVAAAAAALSAQVTDYAAGALYPEPGRAVGGHLFVVEFAQAPDADGVSRFARELDASLAAQNADYRDHRSGGVGMAPPRVRAVPAGTFAAWMASRGKLGGQHKVPRVINDQDLWENLLAFTAAP